MSDAGDYRPLRHLRRWLWCGRLGIVAIVVLSLVPMPDMPSPVEHSDKLEHLLGYFGLTAWYAQLVAHRGRLALYALGYVALGIAIELAQGLTSWRSADWHDLGADAVGIAAGYALAFTPLRHLLERFERQVGWRLRKKASPRKKGPE